ncbi:MAG: hypothetical protein GHCLOJNM_01030 [bacterium]|nr:hypothetical protein [bacterium]
MARRDDNLPEVIYRKHPPLLSSEPSPWVRQPARHLPLFLLLALLSCALIAIDLRTGFSWLQVAAGKVSGPIIHMVDLVLAPVARSVTVIRETLTARSENADLRNRVVELEARLHSSQTALEENIRLRQLLDLKAEVAPEAEAAEVLRYRNEAASRVMILRGGGSQGLSVGQPVITRSGQLLGRITGITDLVSTVRLITDPGSSIGVTLEKTQSQGILYSRDGNLFVRVDRAEEVPEEERVVTSHAGELFPKGLLIGFIEGEAGPIERDPFVAADLGLMKSYRVKTAYPIEDWERIREVLCLPAWGRELPAVAGTRP